MHARKHPASPKSLGLPEGEPPDRKPGDPWADHADWGGPRRESERSKTVTNGPGKSDKPIVAKQGPGPCGIPANQPEPSDPPTATNLWDFWEQVKPRGLTKKNEDDDLGPPGCGPGQG